ncbi:ATP-binding protein [Variovorax sp. HJSM1_2]|uniref:ATP-binding protein n=1 Tax=Variovorax sp. HJSM1_2 TaxID=3366263 RepID=UPI003BE5218F
MNPTANPSGAEFCFGPFTLLPAQRMLLNHGEPVRLGSRALDLLILLAERAGEVVSKEDLICRAWPHAVVEEAGLRVHMAALRKALDEGRSGLRYITNVPLRGYCLVAPVTRRSVAGSLALLPAAATAPPVHLPALLTRLIGRRDAVDTLMAAVPRRRLVTLVGPGGMGKTTVALAAADGLRGHYAHGVRFVDLASITDGALVPSAFAAVLGIPLHSDDAARDVIAWLADKSVLVVMDNCEHVVACAAAFAEALLGGAAGVHILATSRESLRARGEWVQRLTSLAIPPATAQLSCEQALGFAAFELFVERAMASSDGTAFTDEDVPRVAELCRRLDGMPLAIELVAAQVGFFGLGGLVEKLDDHLSLPVLGPRTAQPRHQTLHATLSWSYELLLPAEQRVLMRLSVFRERFTLAAALKLAADGDDAPAQMLMNLVSKSLVVADPGDGTVHYRLLETTRHYAAEQLAQSGDQQEIFHRHAMYCRDVAQAAAAEIETMVPARWRERHGRRIDDVRAALNWAFQQQQPPEIGAQLVAESPALWFGLWLVKEYLGRLSQALASLPAASIGQKLEMQLLVEYGQASMAMRGGNTEGLAALSRSAGIASQLGHTDYQLRALWASFGGQLLRGEYTTALADTEVYGQVAAARNDTQAVFIYHRMKALCLHFLGDQAQALVHARQSLHPATFSIRHANGNGYQFEHRPASLTQLARILWLQGFPDQAMQAAQDAVDAAKAVDHALSLTYALAYGACPIALWCGNDAVAQAYVDELQECADGHSLVFWQSWPRVYRAAILKRAQPAGQAGVLDESGIQISQIDTLATLHPDYVGAAAVARAQAMVNAWCAPEILRVQGLRAWRVAGERGAGEGLLRQSIALATQQGATAWRLRSATDLAELLYEKAALDEARLELLQALAHFQEGGRTADVLRARQVAQLLAPQKV